MKSCTIITCNNCEFYNTQYCKNCSKEGDDCYEHWEWRHDVSWRQEQIDNLTQKISDLETKLAESESRFQVHKQTDVRTIQDQTDLIEQLKQQLEEYKQSLKETIDHYEKYCSEINRQNVMLYAAACNAQQASQDKISFAVEQLEKVKDEFFDVGNGWWLCFRDGTQYMTHNELEGCVRDVIDNQIKQLKEMK